MRSWLLNARPKVREADLQGFQILSASDTAARTTPVGRHCRDKAGNRQLFFDQYAGLLLLYFFNPILTKPARTAGSHRFGQGVQRLLGIQRVSLGSLSESTGVFAAEPLREIVRELPNRRLPLEHGRDAEALRGLTAVDGSFLPALPRMVWALWQDADHRAAKLHLQFDVLRGVPSDATLTPGASSEHNQLRVMLKADRLYVLDRGYAGYQLFRDILDAGSSFVVRVKDNTTFQVAEERAISAEARAAGVVRDVVIAKLGTDHHKDYLGQPVRLVIVRRQRPDGTMEELWLVTDRLDLPAELVALAYRYRWTIELFFRWFKCILGCRHLLANDANGVAIQAYVALIASLLMVLWTNHKPTKRTWEMMQFYLTGWADLEETRASLAQPSSIKTRHVSRSAAPVEAARSSVPFSCLPPPSSLFSPACQRPLSAAARFRNNSAEHYCPGARQGRPAGRSGRPARRRPARPGWPATGSRPQWPAFAGRGGP